ncbi:hypothetical protein Tco_0389127 [Tanacetum coccineum]
MGSFIMGSNVNIMAWNHFVNGMLFNLFKNLYVPFGIPFDPKRYYKDGDCARMLRRPRQVNRVHILDFKGLTPDIRQDLAERMRMVYTRDDGQEDRGRDGIRCGWDFLREEDMLLKRHAEERKSGARLSGGHFIRRLAHHFGLVSDDGLRGLSVVARKLPLIDLGELVRLNIYIKIGDDWAWVAPGPERQQVSAASAPKAFEDSLAIDEGAQADLAPIQAPQLLPPPPAVVRTMPQRLGRLKEEIQGLRRDVGSLRGLVERSMTNQGRVSTWMISCMTQIVKASRQTYQAFDGNFQGSSLAIFERRTRQRTGEASTFAAPQIKPGSKFSTIVREYVIEPSRDLAESKEIDDVGGESTIWKSGSVGVLKLQDGCSTQILAHKLNMENLPSKISGEFLILILF